MRKHFLRQPPPFTIIKPFIETQDPPTALQTISSHLKFVHRMYVLHMHFDTWAIRRFGRPKVQIFMLPSFKIKRVIAVIQISKFRDEIQMML